MASSLPTLLLIKIHPVGHSLTPSSFRVGYLGPLGISAACLSGSWSCFSSSYHSGV